MKNLLSKEHYSYKIQALLMKSSAYPLSADKPLYGLPHFYKQSWSPISMIFQKSQPSNK